ncbi:hypothetical protein SD70_30995 [Gordoniibacillus kamchatkensis]|uniref:Uncharacterized protein n=1 Tax=Gordoniibacillus kamchatkensis TaxID=1590651 RepID=A0ABR5A7X1_9BACL|nr:hypothetical protein SD70_30995 [Paenibacillus sp. VKM B-2647]
MRTLTHGIAEYLQAFKNLRFFVLRDILENAVHIVFHGFRNFLMLLLTFIRQGKNDIPSIFRIGLPLHQLALDKLLDLPA